MPRGVKGSGKAAAKTSKKVPAAESAPVEQSVQIAEKPSGGRKPYPALAERIEMADRKIERLTKLKASRAALVEKTAALLQERTDALERSAQELEKEKAKRARLTVLQQRPAKSASAKLSPEERKERMAAGRAASREAKKLEQQKYDAIMEALKTSGKSVEELLVELQNK